MNGKIPCVISELTGGDAKNSDIIDPRKWPLPGILRPYRRGFHSLATWSTRERVIVTTPRISGGLRKGLHKPDFLLLLLFNASKIKGKSLKKQKQLSFLKWSEQRQVSCEHIQGWNNSHELDTIELIHSFFYLCCPGASLALFNLQSFKQNIPELG